uniref:Uncharacterized protein n=1 Tax=Oryza meridionalis TaxID=40149 RepID=A0A0E0D546_9ORYZ
MGRRVRVYRVVSVRWCDENTVDVPGATDTVTVYGLPPGSTRATIRIATARFVCPDVGGAAHLHAWRPHPLVVMQGARRRHPQGLAHRRPHPLLPP